LVWLFLIPLTPEYIERIIKNPPFNLKAMLFYATSVIR
jgi:hypothetical protein